MCVCMCVSVCLQRVWEESEGKTEEEEEATAKAQDEVGTTESSAPLSDLSE